MGKRSSLPVKGQWDGGELRGRAGELSVERARHDSENCAVHSVFGVQRECQRAGEKLECSPEAGTKLAELIVYAC